MWGIFHRRPRYVIKAIGQTVPRDDDVFHMPPIRAKDWHPVNTGLDPLCPTVRGWASKWRSTDPPPDRTVDNFARKHRYKCDRCYRYTRLRRRFIRAIHDSARERKTR